MATALLIVSIVGTLFGWWVIRFYKIERPILWGVLLIPFGWVGFIGLIIFTIEKIIEYAND